MSSDATVSDDNLPARPVLKDAQIVAGRQDVGAMPARGSVTPLSAPARRVAQARSRRLLRERVPQANLTVSLHYQ